MIEILLLILIVVVITTAFFQWMWNITMPQVFGLKVIRFWQAFRLLIIAGFLFGSGSMIKLNTNSFASFRAPPELLLILATLFASFVLGPALIWKAITGNVMMSHRILDTITRVMCLIAGVILLFFPVGFLLFQFSS